MHRRIFIRNTALVAAGSLILPRIAFALPAGIRMIRENAGIYTERGGTIGFLLARDGIVVIDSQFEDTSRNFIRQLREKSTIPIRFLMNTHHHRDHTEGNISFRGIVESVVAHQNAAANQAKTAARMNTTDKQLYADIQFFDELKMKVEGEKIEGLYFGAAHTNGDAVYHMTDSNIMHVGDLVFNKRHPFVDREAGASISGWIGVLDKVAARAARDTVIIFGHSRIEGEETGGVNEVRLFQDYLQKVLKFAESEYKKGVSKEEFLKNTSIPGVTLWTGDGIERPLTAAYEEVSGG